MTGDVPPSLIIGEAQTGTQEPKRGKRSLSTPDRTKLYTEHQRQLGGVTLDVLSVGTAAKDTSTKGLEGRWRASCVIGANVLFPPT